MPKKEVSDDQGEPLAELQPDSKISNSDKDVHITLPAHVMDELIANIEAKKIDYSTIMNAISSKLRHPSRKLILEIWGKAASRLDDGDTDGAITTARALLETICKLALNETKTEYQESADLPKLYNLAAAALGMSAATQVTRTLKSFFGASTTLVQSVTEMRNQLGDAHGKAEGRLSVPHSQAELVLNVAGSVTIFLSAAIEGYIRTSKRIDRSRRVILKFDKSMVWRLRDHAHNAASSIPNWEEKNPKPALWLVGDAGIYLMSNGSPPISISGDVFTPNSDDRRQRLLALAEGCNPDIDDWWPIHTAIDGGNDFTRTVPLVDITAALSKADKTIILLVSKRKVKVLSDVEFDKSHNV